MTWRELRTFLNQAPRESAFCRSLHGDLVEWGVAENLQAIAINDQRKVHSGKRTLPESNLIKPPAGKSPQPHGRGEPLGAAELDAMFGR